jgi:transglutaminase-like putative cysteine protease
MGAAGEVMHATTAMPLAARYRVLHETIYHYSSQVSSSRQIAHLAPRDTPWQRLLRHSLEVEPGCSERSTGTDYFGNAYERFFVDEPHHMLAVRASSEVVVSHRQPLAGDPSPAWDEVALPAGARPQVIDLEVEQYRVASPAAPVFAAARDYAMPSFPAGRPWLEAVFELTRRIQQEFVYDPGATTISTSVSEVLEQRRGVCQDFAHLMISSLRSLGIAARYVSGYVLNQGVDGLRNAGADASHAWVAAYCPGLGWVDFDPTNGKLANEEFITLGWGREYQDVTPLRGVVLGSATQRLGVAVRVTPLALDPPPS